MCTSCVSRRALQWVTDGDCEQVFRELDAPHEDRGDPLLLDEDGSQSESEEPAFSPTASSKHARGGRRRCLQVRRDRKLPEVMRQLLPWHALMCLLAVRLVSTMAALPALHLAMMMRTRSQSCAGSCAPQDKSLA